MKINCPECNEPNETENIPGGFYFDSVSYKCDCGFILISSDLNFTIAFENLEKEIRLERKSNSICITKSQKGYIKAVSPENN